MQFSTGRTKICSYATVSITKEKAKKKLCSANASNQISRHRYSVKVGINMLFSTFHVKFERDLDS